MEILQEFFSEKSNSTWNLITILDIFRSKMQMQLKKDTIFGAAQTNFRPFFFKKISFSFLLPTLDEDFAEMTIRILKCPISLSKWCPICG